MTIDDSNFKELLEKDFSLVLFWANWCFHCKKAKSYLPQIELDESIKCYTCDVDDAVDFSANQALLGLPTFILYYNGKEHDRYANQSYESLIESIRQSRARAIE